MSSAHGLAPAALRCLTRLVKVLGVRQLSTNGIARRRMLCLALAALVPFVSSQFWTALHFAVVRHEICALHGEILHVGASEADDRSASAPSDGSSRARQHSEPGAHEHCALPTAVSARATLRAAADYGRRPAAAECVYTDAEPGDAPRCMAPLVVAPKQSPPRFASSRV